MSDDNQVIVVLEVDPTKKTSDVLEQTSHEDTVNMEMASEKCYWNDDDFEHGDEIFADGKSYECSYGIWLRLDK